MDQAARIAAFKYNFELEVKFKNFRTDLHNLFDPEIIIYICLKISIENL